ncbi:MAG: DnaA regulatory inactivator Hda [Gammaproteobacteria bacterium]|nr:DnaA regulatory inactivator Hda [Gammaproteobacteria bacterium]
MTINTQLPLAIAIPDYARFDNFYAGSNSELLSQLKKISVGDGKESLYLWGGTGQGKSHLLQASCVAARQQGQNANYLSLQQLKGCSPGILQGYDEADLLCLDDLQLIVGDPEWEEAVFHLYNRLLERSALLVVAASKAPDALGLQLADLTSRLSWGLVYGLNRMDDEDRLAALTLRAQQRGLELAEDAGRYLLRHHARDLRALFGFLDALDHASMVEQRRLTLPFVRDVLINRDPWEKPET